MHTIDPGESFKSWRDAARRILAAGIPPEEILWEKEPNLFAGLAEEPAVYGGPSNTSHPVPKPFIGLARNASCHREPTRWSLLYRILWRLTHGEPRLLSNPADPDVARARNLEKNVHREIHKMHAFVRFRKDGENHDGRERFTAWFEPEHFIVEAASPFFRKRFANMDWSIFTPKGCVHWNGELLQFTEGVERDPFDQADSFEDAWRAYYRSIYNPARIKLKAMQGEMAKRYWKNLPEAGIIDELVQQTSSRVNAMFEAELRPVRPTPKIAHLEKLRNLS